MNLKLRYGYFAMYFIFGSLLLITFVYLIYAAQPGAVYSRVGRTDMVLGPVTSLIFKLFGVLLLAAPFFFLTIPVRMLFGVQELEFTDTGVKGFNRKLKTLGLQRFYAPYSMITNIEFLEPKISLFGRFKVHFVTITYKEIHRGKERVRTAGVEMHQFRAPYEQVKEKFLEIYRDISA